ncbi:MAG: helix-turn-helix domain-containing protein [Candidatus Eiseniibacteriota bacterium]
MDALISARDVATLLGVSLRTVRRLRLPRIRVGRSVRYSKQALTKWLEARSED